NRLLPERAPPPTSAKTGCIVGVRARGDFVSSLNMAVTCCPIVALVQVKHRTKRSQPLPMGRPMHTRKVLGGCRPGLPQLFWRASSFCPLMSIRGPDDVREEPAQGFDRKRVGVDEQNAAGRERIVDRVVETLLAHRRGASH